MRAVAIVRAVRHESDRHAKLGRRYAPPGRAAGSARTGWNVYIASAVPARDRGKVLRQGVKIVLKRIKHD
jgi:hypothetical protein